MHVNVGGEINGITAKATPTSSDLLIIEDAADSNNKKKITIGNLPATSDANAVHVKHFASPKPWCDTQTTKGTWRDTENLQR